MAFSRAVMPVLNLKLVLLVLGLAWLVFVLLHLFVRIQYRRLKRERFLRDYDFPPGPGRKLRERHPQLTDKDVALVECALRDFFLVRHHAGRRMVGMPSRVVDDLWHEFILYSRDYIAFCRGAFGGYFHHVPADSTPDGERIAGGLRLTWRLACQEDNIVPTRPTRLPLLFAIDQKLAIVGGQTYRLSDAARLAAGKSAEREDSDSGGIACGGDDSGGGGGDGCSGGCGGD